MHELAQGDAMVEAVVVIGQRLQGMLAAALPVLTRHQAKYADPGPWGGRPGPWGGWPLPSAEAAGSDSGMEGPSH